MKKPLVITLAVVSSIILVSVNFVVGIRVFNNFIGNVNNEYTWTIKDGYENEKVFVYEDWEDSKDLREYENFVSCSGITLENGTFVTAKNIITITYVGSYDNATSVWNEIDNDWTEPTHYNEYLLEITTKDGNVYYYGLHDKNITQFSSISDMVESFFMENSILLK